MLTTSCHAHLNAGCDQSNEGIRASVPEEPRGGGGSVMCELEAPCMTWEAWSRVFCKHIGKPSRLERETRGATIAARQRIGCLVCWLARTKTAQLSGVFRVYGISLARHACIILPRHVLITLSNCMLYRIKVLPIKESKVRSQRTQTPNRKYLSVMNSFGVSDRVQHLKKIHTVC